MLCQVRTRLLAGFLCQRVGVTSELSFLCSSIHAPLCIRPASDKGPERNYRRKMKKKMMKSPKAQIVFEHLKDLQQSEVAGKEGASDADSVKKLLSEIKVHVPTNAEVRKRLGMPEKFERVTRQLKDKGRQKRIGFMDPTSGGERLGVFMHPKPGVKVLEPGGPTFAEEDERQFVKSLELMKQKNQFEVAMEDRRFPRRFPIDNEDYESEEHSVGFEDHILLDHLLEGFPKRGPVRHFMELVITGLSKNPHYSAHEKKDYVQWYRKYLDGFTPEELQSVATSNHQDAK